MDYLYDLKNALAGTDVPSAGGGDRSLFLLKTKAFVSEKKRDLMRMHLEGMGGAAVVARYTGLADALISFIFEKSSRGADACSRSGLIALGGYGRKELCFCSDLDIMLLHDGPLQQSMETLNDFLVPFLWDIGFTVGHSVRSVDEALRLARNDDVVLTSMLEGRLLLGNSDFLASFKQQLFAQLRAEGIKKFIRVKKRERAQDYREAGSEVYHSEPNIKLTAGGLRDYHTGIWAVLAQFGLKSLSECHTEGLLTEDQFLRIERALDFIWRVRNQMHLDGGAPHDVLTLSRQEKIAAVFGYQPTRGALPVELFMQDYYSHAHELHHFYEEMLRLAGFSRPVRQQERPRGGRMDHGLKIARRRVFLPPDDSQWFREDPPRLLEVFWYSQKRGIMLSESGLNSIRNNLVLIDDNFRSSPVARDYFLAILADPSRVGATIRQMSEIGLLDRYLPEFAQIRNLVRYDSFHQYPVHEHTLRALETLAVVPQLKELGTDILKGILTEVKDPAIVSLAILLHDFGKAHEASHVTEGTKIAEAIASRFGLNGSRLHTLNFLVRNHLKMAHLSQYRDIEDLAIIRSFAAEVGSIEMMNMLYLLTFADLYAVRQGSWNDWKSALLYHLYQRTKQMLEEPPSAGGDGTSAGGDGMGIWESAKARAVNQYLPKKEASEVRRHLELLSDRYLRAFTPKEIAEHIRMIATLKSRNTALKCMALPQYSFSHIVICTRDRLGLFADIAGTFAAQQISILNASIFTRSDGVAIDSFYVVDARGDRPLTSTKWAQVKDHLRKVLRGERDVKRLLQSAEQSPRSLQRTMVSLRRGVYFDNHVSATHTVIDIEAPDRVGLLYDIASTFSAMGLNLSVAKITTDVRQAHDAFYVTDENNKKIVDPLRLQEIEERLEEALERRNPAAASLLISRKKRRVNER
ncbi:MAG: [protein-PII] uridylyltransferase [Candidatus Abyssobacteria bacterium SURF_5]|uniref:Bifunctional uridylyltransferase/uridylyl-removing enzyme n=1 Tax=Abyssobacteria bacterium (strain SURF_5) TaxID=2093360 RepID=A0A3A4NTU6_ABYX5|nr:MAG: [protein-PII] uridylyltransferase [Candidatus Abyssubacteria bacterium SURF_5]